MTPDINFTTPEITRPIYWFEVPEALAQLSGVRKIGIIELLSKEELMATSRAGRDPIALGYELAKACLRYINDERMTTADNTTDKFWASMAPGMAKVRQLVITAYGAIHNVEDGDTKSFLSSQRTEVG